MLAEFHETWGPIAAAIAGVIGVWGLILAALKRQPGTWYWVGVALATFSVLTQVMLGLIAFNQEGTRDPGSQHVFYGVVTMFTFAFAYIYRLQLAKKPALYWGVLMLFVMGLGIRGIGTFGHSF